MATGLEDYVRLSFLSEQAAVLYFARVYMKISQNLSVTDRRIIPGGETLYVEDGVQVSETGILYVAGTLVIVEE